MNVLGWVFIIVAVYLVRAVFKGQVFDANGNFVLAQNISDGIIGAINGKYLDPSADNGLNKTPTDTTPTSIGGVPNPKDDKSHLAISEIVPGARIGQRFGVKNSRYQAGYHTGVDLVAPEGAPVHNYVAGTVLYIGGAYGNGIIVTSTDGHAYLYGHLSRRAVADGAYVEKGKVIGYVGHTGNADGPHLHFEKSKGNVWRYGDVMDPLA